jgi:hypothetical protein
MTVFAHVITLQLMVINDLLDYELVKSTNQPIKKEPVNVDAVALSVTRMFTSSARNKVIYALHITTNCLLLLLVFVCSNAAFTSMSASTTTDACAVIATTAVSTCNQLCSCNCLACV